MAKVKRSIWDELLEVGRRLLRELDETAEKAGRRQAPAPVPVPARRKRHDRNRKP